MRAGISQHHDPGSGQQRTREVDEAARARDGDGERAEELQRRGQCQADTIDRRIQAQVHDAERSRQADDQHPLISAQAAQARTGYGSQDERGDDLPDGDHPDRADCGKRGRAESSTGLVRRGAGEHQRDAGCPPPPTRARQRLRRAQCDASVLLRVFHAVTVSSRRHILIMHLVQSLYGCRMDWSLRALRIFVAAVEAGSFTDAAIALRVSQASVSRTIASLEKQVGDPLLRRLPHGCEPTPTGQQLLPHIRRLLAEADRLTGFVQTRHGVLRLGYAWAALGRHTLALQRVWAAEHPTRELHLIRHNSATAGLLEGACDVAIVRRPVDGRRFDSTIVGLERRVVAFASDDAAWARRRRVSMAEVAERTIIIDPRTGATSADLWADAPRVPHFAESSDVDEWLDAIAAGRGVGTTSEATAQHHARPGIAFRPIKDGPRIAVWLTWWRDHPPEGLADLINAVTGLYADQEGGGE